MNEETIVFTNQQNFEHLKCSYYSDN